MISSVCLAALFYSTPVTATDSDLDLLCTLAENGFLVPAGSVLTIPELELPCGTLVEAEWKAPEHLVVKTIAMEAEIARILSGERNARLEAENEVTRLQAEILGVEPKPKWWQKPVVVGGFVVSAGVLGVLGGWALSR